MESRATLLIGNVLLGKAEDFNTFQKSYQELNMLLIKASKVDRDKFLDMLTNLVRQNKIKDSYLQGYSSFIGDLNQRKKTNPPEVEYHRSIKSDLITFDPLSNPWQLYYEDRLQANEKLDPDQLKVMDQASGATQMFNLIEKHYLFGMHHFFNPSLWYAKKEDNIACIDLGSEDSAKKAVRLCRGLEKYQLCRNRILGRVMHHLHGKVWEAKIQQIEKQQQQDMKKIQALKLKCILDSNTSNTLKIAFNKLTGQETDGLSSENPTTKTDVQTNQETQQQSESKHDIQTQCAIEAHESQQLDSKIYWPSKLERTAFLIEFALVVGLYSISKLRS